MFLNYFLLSFFFSYNAGAFTIQSKQLNVRELKGQSRRALHANNHNTYEFDFVLRELPSSENVNTIIQPSRSRRQVALTDSINFHRTILASSASFPMPASDVYKDALLADDADDPYASVLGEQVTKIQKLQEVKQTSTIERKLKSMDLQDIVVTLFIPGVLAFVGFRYVFNRATTKVNTNKNMILESFAKEMMYNDGNNKRMESCINEYKNKLVWLGPQKNDVMLRYFLETYAKKKTVSPKAISSISHVFNVFKLSEAKAAATLVSLCKQMGTDKISSASKLLFLGSRIFKSAEGKAALQPIRELIMSTYREEAVAATLVETSQQAIAEAAYRTTVLMGGKKQTSLTPGWEVLGLTKEDATRIFEEEKKVGFVSERESMYGGQTRKYDKKGRQIDNTGKLVNPDEASGDDDADDTDSGVGATSNAYECGNCGFTLFVAAGRETKFFGPNFKCPECGAPKSGFTTRGQDDN